MKKELNLIEKEFKGIEKLESFREKQEMLNKLYEELYQILKKINNKKFFEEISKEIVNYSHRPYVNNSVSFFHSKMNQDVFKVKSKGFEGILKKIQKKLDED